MTRLFLHLTAVGILVSCPRAAQAQPTTPVVPAPPSSYPEGADGTSAPSPGSRVRVPAPREPAPLRLSEPGRNSRPPRVRLSQGFGLGAMATAGAAGTGLSIWGLIRWKERRDEEASREYDEWDGSGMRTIAVALGSMAALCLVPAAVYLGGELMGLRGRLAGAVWGYLAGAAAGVMLLMTSNALTDDGKRGAATAALVFAAATPIVGSTAGYVLSHNHRPRLNNVRMSAAPARRGGALTLSGQF